MPSVHRAGFRRCWRPLQDANPEVVRSCAMIEDIPSAASQREGAPVHRAQSPLLRPEESPVLRGIDAATPACPNAVAGR